MTSRDGAGGRPPTPNRTREDENEGGETGSPPSNPTDSAAKTPSPEHENPIDAGDVTDADRAGMLADYLAAFTAEFGVTPKLMPLDAEGKEPWIAGRCSLESAEADAALVSGDEAVRRIREKAERGFALYAGRPDHGTENVVFADHDDPEAFPAPTATPTLKTLTGSGRGPHETYRNDPKDPVRNARVGENAGEIRAENWYVVVPGSIHPSGGVYHIIESREIATISDSDLTDRERPASASRDSSQRRKPPGDLEGEGESPSERLEAAFEKSPTGEKYRNIYNGNYAAAGYDDRSSAEYALACWLDMWVGFGDEGTVARLMDASNAEKWAERPDDSYRDSILSGVGHQDWYADNDGGEPVAILPKSPSARAAANGWDWRNADRSGVEDALTLDAARERTKKAVADAYQGNGGTLVDALPTTGKTHGAIAAAAETGEPITIFTTRGNREQYAQIKELCDEHRLRAKILPSFTRDCETANGEHGEQAAETVKEWYRRGATGKDIHIHYEDETGEPIPCEGPAGARCSYKAGWQFDPEEYDVFIGHYLHAHVSSATKGRTVVFDEFPGGAFETELFGERLAGVVTRYLKSKRGALPFEDYNDLLAGRDDPERRAKALAYFENHDPEREAIQAFANDGHALAPVATYTILAGAGEGNDLGNGWEHASLPGDTRGIGAFTREDGVDRVHLLRPPDLKYARGVVGLDGTPTPWMWNLALGTRLKHRQVLTDDERREYIRHALGLNVFRTTNYIKSYNSPDHVNPANDAAYLDAILARHGRSPAVLTTRTAEKVYDTEGIGDGDGRVSALAHYGDLKGSNRFASERLGAVIGSNHYGDGFIQKWGAFAGERVERVGDGKGVDLEYSGRGDDVHRHMTEHETLQAIMRFGRDGGGATVYVETNTIPEWVPLAGEPPSDDVNCVRRTRGDGERSVITALRDLGKTTTAKIGDHPAVDIGPRAIRKHLKRLADAGHVKKIGECKGTEWTDDGLDAIPENGDVELPEFIGTPPYRDSIRDRSEKISRESIPADAFAESEGRAVYALTDGGLPPPAPGD